MHRTSVVICAWVFLCLCTAAHAQKANKSADRELRPVPLDVRPTAQRSTAVFAGSSLAARGFEAVDVRGSDRVRLGGSAVAGGPPPGAAVYVNASDNPSLYRPGAGVLIADRLKLVATGGCNMVHYSLVVLGSGASGEATFTVHTELWDGDPCDGGTAVIAGTEQDFADVPNDGSLVELNAFFDTSPISIPDTVYLAVTFGPAPAGDDAGWIVAGRSELGFTENQWSERPPLEVCERLFFGCGGPHAGFWATIRCDITTPQSGACCDGETCTEVLEADCTTGTWQGPFTKCTPNPCVSGACCGGALLNACTETTPRGCESGLFLPNATCDTNPCGSLYSDYANTYPILGFHSTDNPFTQRADDVKRHSLEPCELGGYEILVSGNGDLGPASFDVQLSLWTNDQGDVGIELDDRPDQLIVGTESAYVDVPADFCEHRLVAGSFAGQGIMLPRKFWVSITTSSSLAGPMLAGPAKMGGSVDGFAEFDTAAPDAWVPGFWFGGFNPDQACNPGSPGEVPPCPAGSFRINVWCAGDRPTGACCDDLNNMCLDGVIEADCPGRWMAGVTCAGQLFDPPCGNNACCSPNPVDLACQERSPEACAALEPPGVFSAGKFCQEITCPSRTCYDATGDCFTSGATPGCEDAFCCEAVCADDDFCCTDRWDVTCAETATTLCQLPANDSYSGAQQISGQGVVEFDTGKATSEGPNHDDCATLGDLTGVVNDLWYCWTAPCTGLGKAETCNRTLVDTKMVVYGGCEGPPADANLLTCNDDACGYQSRTSFAATAGQDYLIRMGSFSAAGTGGDEFPQLPLGPGAFSIECRELNNPACPGEGACCDEAGTGTPACDDPFCCNLVCDCDPFCCGADGGEWDSFCATTGFQGNGCGAQALCGDLCAPSCPSGVITWLDPADGVVDARLAIHPRSGLPAGIEVVLVQAPPNADASCFTLCETDDGGAPNSLIDVSETPISGGASSYTLTLARPITPAAATTITYTNDDGIPATATLISHSGNVNGDGMATAADITALINVLSGVDVGVNAPWGNYSADTDHSGTVHPPDIIGVVDALNGAGGMTPSADTTRPDPTGVCP